MDASRYDVTLMWSNTTQLINLVHEPKLWFASFLTPCHLLDVANQFGELPGF